MQSATPTTVIAFTLTLAGCNFDPKSVCEQQNGYYIHPLALSDAVKQDCEACGQSPCPEEDDGGGETGDEFDGMLTCMAGESEGYLYKPTLCIVGDRQDLDPVPFGSPGVTDCGAYNNCPWISRPAHTCPELSGPFPCESTWADVGDSFCVMCEARHDDEPEPYAVQPLGDDSSWPLCHLGAPSQPYWLADVFNLGGPGWIQSLLCSDANVSPTPTGYKPVFIGPANQLYPDATFSTLTFECPTGLDSECPAGLVCEAGWVFEGMIPKPTLCTWDGAPLVAGPAVYGLDAWEQGIEVDGDTITLSVPMLLALVPIDGEPIDLLNDDQRVDERGLITRCGPESLCAHVGLAVGDRLGLDRFDPDALLAGESTDITVTNQRGVTRVLTIEVDPVW